MYGVSHGTARISVLPLSVITRANTLASSLMSTRRLLRFLGRPYLAPYYAPLHVDELSLEINVYARTVPAHLHHGNEPAYFRVLSGVTAVASQLISEDLIVTVLR